MKVFKIVFLVFAFVLVTNVVEGQERTTKIQIKLEAEIVDMRYQIKLYTADKEMEPLYVNGGIILPEDFKNEKKIGVKLISGQYALDFQTIDVSDFMADWTIGIDNPPFEEATVGHLPGEDRVGPGLIYYIMFFHKDGKSSHRKTIIDRKYKNP